ncbi:MAG: rhodanese-like domain-containing protein [Elusimicrobia bacterium]|nr:rhodanese-like domain-containing protein [Elusimicrobiota bacterium]
MRASLLRWILTTTLWTLAACAAPAPAPQGRVLLAPEAQAETPQASSRPAGIPKISAETLRRKQVFKDPFLLLDVRPAQNYAMEHIAGAKNIPLDELSFNLHEIPRDLDVVCYCGGGACPLGAMAVERLRLKGYDRVFELEGGIEEWKRRGYPLH